MSQDKRGFERSGGPGGPGATDSFWILAPRWAVIGIFLLLGFGALMLARDFLMPLSMGVLLFFVFSPACRFFVRLGLPRGMAAGAITAALLLGLLVAIAALAVPLTTALDRAPTLFWRLEYKLEALRGSVEDIRAAAEKLDELAAGGKEPGAISTAAEDGNILTQLARTTPTLFAQLAFTFVLLYFMLASGPLLYTRIVQSFSAIGDKKKALEAMYEIEDSLGGYLGTITLINAGLGAAVGLAMWAWGMPAPALFGAAAFAFNYIPYFGAVGGVVIATLVAAVTMNGLLGPVLVGLTYFALTAVEGQLVTPHFVSRRLRLNTVVVFVTVALWAWLWSIIGMIVAVPILVVLRVLCAHVPALKSFGNFLAAEDAVPPGRAERAS